VIPLKEDEIGEKKSKGKEDDVIIIDESDSVNSDSYNKPSSSRTEDNVNSDGDSSGEEERFVIPNHTIEIIIDEDAITKKLQLQDMEIISDLEQSPSTQNNENNENSDQSTKDKETSEKRKKKEDESDVNEDEVNESYYDSPDINIESRNKDTKKKKKKKDKKKSKKKSKSKSKNKNKNKN